MGGLTTPKGGETKQTTSVQQVPAYVQAAQGNLLNAANGILSPYLQQQGFTTAPLNSDQTAAYDLTRQLAQGAFTNPTANTNAAPTTPTLSPLTGKGYSMTPTQAAGYSAAAFDPTGYTANTASAVGYDPRMATAAQVTGADISALMNPYLSDVVGTTGAAINRAANQQQAQAAARSAAAGSFGGSRQAIQSAQISRAAGEQLASTTAQLMSAGFDKATATALANAQMRQQTELANQSAANTAGQFKANAENNVSQFNAGARNNADQFTATARNNASSANAAAENAARAFGASAYNTAQAADARASDVAAQFSATAANDAARQNNANDLSRYQLDLNRYSTQAGIDQALKSGDFSRQLQAIQALLGVGNAQRDMYQTSLNQPLQMLQLLGSLTPQQYGSTTIGTAPNTAPSPLQSIISGIGSVATAPLNGGGTLFGKAVSGLGF